MKKAPEILDHKTEAEALAEYREVLSEALVSVVEQGHEERLLALLREGAQADAWGFAALNRAASQGRTRCLEILLPFCSDPTIYLMALWAATCGGHSSCVELLLQKVDVHQSGAELMQLAASRGDLKSLHCLMEVCQPGYEQLERLILDASAGAHSHTVAALTALMEKRYLAEGLSLDLTPSRSYREAL